MVIYNNLELELLVNCLFKDEDIANIALGMRLFISYMAKNRKKEDLSRYFSLLLERKSDLPQDEIVWFMVTSWNMAVNEYTITKATSKWCDVSFLLLKLVEDKENYSEQMENAYQEMMS
eukprot:NODE_349_length_10402_cov_0.251286.p9 type:complete len:119 gc:universal NODE_349_length_10402_cov_0.251286:8109-7753(-)